MSALALLNGSVMVDSVKNFQRIKRAKIDKGNNGSMVKQIVKKRSWWNTTDNMKQANLIWTQKIVKNLSDNS